MSSKLNPGEVRKCVKLVDPNSRELSTLSESVLSFLTAVDDKNTICRINVYLESGTIGCNRVLGNQVRESFVRNINTMDAFAKVLRHPPKMMHIDKSLGGRDLVSKMELAEVGVCVLMGERAKLASHLKAIEEKTDTTKDEIEPEEGMEFAFSLPADVMNQVNQCLSDISKMNKRVNCVTTNGRGGVFLYGNGGVAYTPGIPRALYSKLKALRTNPKATRPSYVAIGTKERYFVSFLNGSCDWKGAKPMNQALKRSRIAPRSVAFGSTFDTFFIVYDDGSWEYQGRGIPKDLEIKLKERKEKADLVCVTLGPKGEWFLRAQNGRMWWGGIGADLDSLVQDLLKNDRYLNFLDFGEDGTYFVSYD